MVRAFNAFVNLMIVLGKDSLSMDISSHGFVGFGQAGRMLWFGFYISKSSWSPSRHLQGDTSTIPGVTFVRQCRPAAKESHFLQ